MHWNYVLSTLGVKNCTADLKDLFLMAALEECEYLRIHMTLTPAIYIKYKLEDIFDKDGHVCTEVHGSMHGFPQAGMLAHKDLVKRLTWLILHNCFTMQDCACVFSACVCSTCVSSVQMTNILSLSLKFKFEVWKVS